MSYTPGMKTAVSIPDGLFEEAERLAKRTKRSRSRVFSDALREYLARHSSNEITRAMDEALSEIGIEEDGFGAASARRTLERNEW